MDRATATVTAANVDRSPVPGPIHEWVSHLPLCALDGRLLGPDEHPLTRLAAGETVNETLLAPGPSGPRSVSVATQLLEPDGLGLLSIDLAADDLRDRAVAATELSITIAGAGGPDHPLVYVNPAFERVTGYSSAEAVGRDCRFLQGESTDPAAVAALRKALAAEEGVTVTLLNYRKDGSAFWNEISISPVRDGSGAVTNFVGVQHDVTARVVAERSRELAYASEQQARSEAEAAQGRLAFLAEASAALDSSLEVDTILDRFGRLAVPRLANGTVLILDGDEQVAPSTSAHSPDPTEQARLAGPDTTAAVAALSLHSNGRPRVAEGEEVAGLGAAVAIVLPLNARGRRLGTAVLLRESPEPPPEQELILAGELARRAALALDNGARYRERDHIARVLQASLLPPVVPDLPGVELATRYVPAGTGAEVGGDFYDVFETGEGWGIAIGDVCGKGPDAAAVTGLARHTIRAAAVQDARPAHVLRVLNKALLAADLGDRFVTAAFASYSRRGERSRLVLSLGGHPRPMLVRAGGVVPVGVEGTLLGVLDEVDLEEVVVHLRPGDGVVWVTDGVLEASSAHGELGEDGLAASLAGAGGLSAQEVADAVVGAVLDHSGGRPSDDLAVVVLRVPVA